MNSLNLLSASVLGSSRPAPQRSHSLVDTRQPTDEPPSPMKRAQSHFDVTTQDRQGPRPSWLADRKMNEVKIEKEEDSGNRVEDEIGDEDEKQSEAGLTKPPYETVPPLHKSSSTSFTPIRKASRSRGQFLLQRLAGSATETLRWLFGKIFAPGYYLLALFYTEDGHFSPLLPVHRLLSRKSAQPGNKSRQATRSEKRQSRNAKSRLSSSDSDGDLSSGTDKGAGHASSSDESGTSRRSIRIKQNEETARRRKQRKKTESPEEVLAKELKSPISSSSSSKPTRYPHAPAPPRPLIPPRLPSYSSKQPQPMGLPKKTLVLDLDETLIHSMAKGGRMSTGHMVEVRLSVPASYGNMAMGPQHPILYYVHKRPYCDEFLRQVSKWYNLVIFTASVQEYADPVIDWLELERKYFSARYYRQHCTFRNGAYIKDLGSIEPDLSRVMILDNSPLSYIFHEDNALPIEGWINDPTDYDLMHLIPILEGIQFITDVRAFLGLRRGEIDTSGSISR